MIKVKCPNCVAVMQIPEDALGKRGTCKSCKHTFIALAMTATTLPPPLIPPLSVADIPTVVARRRGPAPRGRRLHVGWVLGAIVALAVPIVAASVYRHGVAKDGPRGSRGAAAPSLTYAGIEIGSNGPRYCVVEFLATKGGANFKVLANEQTGVRLTERMEKTGKFNPQELRKTVEAVRAFHDRIVNEYKLPPERIAIVSSEGLFGTIALRKDLDQKEKDRLTKECQKTLSKAVKEATGQTMEFVPSIVVAKHQIKAVVPESDRGDAVFLDIGSGATRGGYSDSSGLIQDRGAIGIRKFMGVVNDGLEDGSFADRAKALTESHLLIPFRNEFGNDPEFTARRKIYLAGGIVWVMANVQHPNIADEYVQLDTADITAFTAAVRKNPSLLTSLQPPSSVSEERSKWLKTEYAKMRPAFSTPERLIAGTEILQALSDELKFGNREIRFYRPCDFAWVASYIEETRRSPK